MHKQHNVSDEALKLGIFSFSLIGEASSLLNDLSAQSITTWEELMSFFLEKFFPLAQMLLSALRSCI